MVFVLPRRGEKMEYLVKKLIKNEEWEKRIKIICSFNKAKCNFEQVIEWEDDKDWILIDSFLGI